MTADRNREPRDQQGLVAQTAAEAVKENSAMSTGTNGDTPPSDEGPTTPRGHLATLEHTIAKQGEELQAMREDNIRTAAESLRNQRATLDVVKGTAVHVHRLDEEREKVLDGLKVIERLEEQTLANMGALNRIETALGIKAGQTVPPIREKLDSLTEEVGDTKAKAHKALSFNVAAHGGVMQLAKTLGAIALALGAIAAAAAALVQAIH